MSALEAVSRRAVWPWLLGWRWVVLGRLSAPRWQSAPRSVLHRSIQRSLQRWAARCHCPMPHLAQDRTQGRVAPVATARLPVKVVPVGALAASHALAETGLRWVRAALCFELADGDTHAAGGVDDSVKAGVGQQQVGTGDLLLLKGNAAGLNTPVAELDDQTRLAGFIGERRVG